MNPELVLVSYDTGVVLLSILVAAFASFAALSLANRMHQHRGWAAALWPSRPSS
jgi:NO-binding membrane sensor protein with MHYT domain